MDLISVSGLNRNIQVEWPFAGSCCKDIALRESLLPFKDAFMAQGRTFRDRVYGWRIISWFRRIRWIRFRVLIYEQGCKMILGLQQGCTIHSLQDVKPDSTVVSLVWLPPPLPINLCLFCKHPMQWAHTGWSLYILPLSWCKHWTPQDS